MRTLDEIIAAPRAPKSFEDIGALARTKRQQLDDIISRPAAPDPVDTLDLALKRAGVANPDLEVKRQALAKQLEIPTAALPPTSDAELEVFRKSNPAGAVYKRSPAASAFLSKGGNAEIVGKDFGTLAEIEQTYLKEGGSNKRVLDLLKNLGGSAVAAYQHAESSLVGGYGQLAGDILSKATTPISEKTGLPDAGKTLSDFFGRYRAYSDQQASNFRPDQANMGLIERGAYMGVESAVSTAGALALAGPTRALTLLSLIAGGGSVGRGRDEGLGLPERVVYGAADAAIEYGTEVAAMFSLVKVMSEKTGLVKNLKNFFISEGLGEQVATHSQDLNEWLMISRNKGKTFVDYMHERPEAAALTLVATLVGGSLQVGAVKSMAAGFEKMQDRHEKKNVEAYLAGRNRAMLETLGKQAAADPLRKRTPEAFHEFLRMMSENGHVSDVYVNAGKLDEILNQEGITDAEILKKMPAVAHEMSVARGAKGDVRISLADYLTHFAGSKVEAGILDHLKVTPNGMTYAEAKTSNQKQQEDLTAQAAQIVADHARVLTAEEFTAQQPEGSAQTYEQYLAEHTNTKEVYTADLQKVHDTLLKGLNSTGRFRPEVNAAQVIPIKAFYAVNAAKEGVLPSELYARFPLNFQSLADTGGLAQDETVVNVNRPGGKTAAFFTKMTLGEGGVPGAFNPQDPSILNQARSVPQVLAQSHFYSALSREIGGLYEIANKQGYVKVEQARAWIEARQKEGKFKKAEVEALGLMDYLELQRELSTRDHYVQLDDQGVVVASSPEPKEGYVLRKGLGAIPVADIEDFVKQNGLQLTEVVLGGEEDTQGLREAAREYENWMDEEVQRQMEEFTYPYYVEEDKNRADDEGPAWLVIMDGSVAADGFATEAEAQEAAGSANEDAYDALKQHLIAQQDPFDKDAFLDEQKGATKFRDYQLPGGEGYREFTLNLPGARIYTAPEAHSMGGDAGDVNRLLHFRVSIRTSKDGKKTLFIEEIQSDWAQEGRDKGFGLTRAPFVTDTKAWVALAVKRILRLAAEEGMDQVAWTTGEQQVARYSRALQSKVDSISWTKTPEGVHLVGHKKTGRMGYSEAEYRTSQDVDGLYTVFQPRDIAGVTSWVTVSSHESYMDASIEAARLNELIEAPVLDKVVDTVEKENSLSAAIGKAMADRIKNDPNQKGSIEGTDININSTGMSEFYEGILIQVVNSVLKSLGGGKVETLPLNRPASYSIAWETTEGEVRYIVRPSDGLRILAQGGVRPEQLDGLFGKEQADVMRRPVADEGKYTYSYSDVVGGSIGESFKYTSDSDVADQPGFILTPELRAKITQGLPLFQGNIARYNTSTFTISMLQGADLSSVHHEAAHFYLQALAEMAGRPNAPPQVKADFRKALDWLGIKGDETITPGQGGTELQQNAKVDRLKAAGSAEAWILFADANKLADFGKIKTLEQARAAAETRYQEAVTAPPEFEAAAYMEGLDDREIEMYPEAIRGAIQEYRDGNRNGGVDQLLRDVSVARRQNLARWVHYLEKVNPEAAADPFWRDYVVSNVNKSVRPDQPDTGLPFNAAALASVYGEFSAGRVPNFAKAYRKALLAATADTVELGDASNGWRKVPRTKKTDPDFPRRVAEVQAISSESWCTKTYNAAPYLEEGDFWVYVANGRPELAIRFKGSDVAEIQGRANDGSIPPEYADRVTELVESGKIKNLTARTKSALARASASAILLRELKRGGAVQLSESEASGMGATGLVFRKPISGELVVTGNLTLSKGASGALVTSVGGNLILLEGASAPLVASVGGNLYLYRGTSAPLVTSVRGDLILREGASAPLVASVGGGLWMYEGASAPLVTSVGGGLYLYDGASAPLVTSVGGDLTLHKGTSAPLVTSVGGNLTLHKGASAPPVASVGGDMTLYDGASAPLVTSVGGDLTLREGASAPLVTSVGGRLALHAGASAPLVASVGGDLWLYEGASTPLVTSVGGSLILAEGASAPLGAKFRLGKAAALKGTPLGPGVLHQGGNPGTPGDLPPGRTPEEVWNAMSIDQQRPYHEQWAQSLERYMLEGKSPTMEMQTVFARFREWMLSVYTSLAEFLEQNPLAGKLNDDIRQVFDRLLASEEAIQEAETARGYAPIFSTSEEAGVPQKQFDEYVEDGKTSTERAVDDLYAAIKALQKEADGKRKVIRAQVTDEVETEPIEQARTFLRTGETLDAKGRLVKAAAGFKLNLDEVKALFPGTGLVNPDLTKLRGMTSPDGISLDLAAQMFGFSSGEALVLELIQGESTKDKVDAMTDQRMLEQHGELSSPQAIERAAEAAIHNDARARFMAAGLKMLTKSPVSVAQLTRAAKQAAESAIASKLIRDLHPSQYERAEMKANKEAVKKAPKDPAGAISAQRAALLNNQLAKATQEALSEVQKHLRYLSKFDNSGTRKALDSEYLEQIDDLLQPFDLRKGQTLKAISRNQSLVEWIAQQEALGFEPNIDPVLMEAIKKKSYKDMTMEELRGLVDSIKQVDHLGRLKHKLLTARDARAFAERVQEAEDSIRGNANRTVEERATPTDVVGLTARWGRMMAASHRKFNSFIREMDGSNDNGVMWNLLARPMNDAGDIETESKQVATEAIAKLFELLPKDIVPGNLYARKRAVPGTHHISMTHEQRIMFAMNWGNEGNRQRLLDGGITGQRALSETEAAAILDTLTQNEWEFVQGVWDYIGTYKDQIGALEKQITGVEPEWIPASEVVTKYGTYRGGYFPAKYDAELSTRSESLEAAASVMDMKRSAFNASSARNSYTKARAEQVINRPILLSYNAISQHVSEVTHRLAWQRWLIDANRLLKALDTPIREHYGPEVLRELRDAVSDIAAGDAPAKNPAEAAINRVRVGSTIVGLGWRVTTALLQPSGLAQSWVRVGGPWIAKGVGRYLANPLSSSDFVNSKSKLMTSRGITMQREINEVLNTIRAGDKVSTVTASYFTLIGKMQRIVDIPTWLGAYEKGLAGLTYQGAADDTQRQAIEEHAAALADQAVIDSQSGGQMKDLAKVQRGSPAMKMFTNFYSYFSATYNLNIEAYRKADFKSPVAVAGLAVDLLILNTIPVVFSLALKEMLKGECDYDLECLTEKLGHEQAGFLFGQMVLLREVGAAVDVATGAKGYGYSGPAGLRFFADLYKLGQQAGQGEADMAAFKAANNVAGALLHYPAGQINTTLEGIMAVEDGRVEGVSILPALIAGPPKH